MGADLYINEIYDLVHAKYEPLFDKAIKARDSFIIKRDTIFEINQFVRKSLGKSEGFMDDPLLVPENMTLPPSLNGLRNLYNRYVKAQMKVTRYYIKMYSVGYFRDSYNGTSLFWRLGLSWWNNNFIKEGVITPDKAKEILTIVKTTKMEPVDENWLKENHCSLEGGPASWNKYFARKKKAFIKFLQIAIDNGYNISASV